MDHENQLGRRVRGREDGPKPWGLFAWLAIEGLVEEEAMMLANAEWSLVAVGSSVEAFSGDLKFTMYIGVGSELVGACG